MKTVDSTVYIVSQHLNIFRTQSTITQWLESEPHRPSAYHQGWWWSIYQSSMSGIGVSCRIEFISTTWGQLEGSSTTDWSLTNHDATQTLNPSVVPSCGFFPLPTHLRFTTDAQTEPPWTHSSEHGPGISWLAVFVGYSRWIMKLMLFSEYHTYEAKNVPCTLLVAATLTDLGSKR